ncbi:hypothetical protein [Actinobaculum sp. 313]|uniref:hypothetical protein n=1 Tax=Actinobaculum sp. 313 TaxID=2495645 RepID=UPI000D528DAC|nr:hypothetical protein [Actinobaculum sp. 313]AWE42063.1 hypothetical protein DDD63_04000 [Actinobaculum sp. 313]
MSELKFDREAAGIQQASHWSDSQTFVNIAGGYRGLTYDCYEVKDNVVNNSSTLSDACAYFVSLMNTACLEFSDAASMLGSGIKQGADDYDQTETEITENFDFMMLAEDDD